MRSLQLAAAFAVLAMAMASVSPSAPPPQTIVYFLVDDLGFANVGYNNQPNAEPLTPTIDALHDSGAELTNYYAYKFCSPTRSSFLSGRLPIHVNQQNHPPTSPAGGVPKVRGRRCCLPVLQLQLQLVLVLVLMSMLTFLSPCPRT